MLLLIDLDNTLIDRTAAFKAWAGSRFGPDEVPWLADADADGTNPANGSPTGWPPDTASTGQRSWPSCGPA